MRKPYLRSLLLVMVLGLVVGLVGGSAVAKQVVVRHLVKGQVMLDNHKALAEAFMAKHPDITIKLEIADTDYDDKLTVLVAAGTPPDVGYANSAGNYYLFSHRGYFMDLGDFIKRSGFNLQQYYPGALNHATYKGAIYGLPVMTHPGVNGLAFNKELFDKTGLSYPTSNWTYEGQFLTAARRITADTNGDGKIDRWGFHSTPGTQDTDTLIYSMGGRYLDESGTKSLAADPVTVQAYKFFTDLVHGYHVHPRPGEAQNIQKEFQLGNLAMMPLGAFVLTSPAIKDAKFRYGIVESPLGTAGRVPAGAASDLWVVMKGSQNAEAAWEWISYLCGVEGLTLKLNTLNTSNPVPIARLNRIFLDRYQDYQVFLNGLESPYFLSFMPHNMRQADARALVQKAVVPIWSAEEAVESVLIRLDQQLKALLQEPLKS